MVKVTFPSLPWPELHMSVYQIVRPTPPKTFFYAFGAFWPLEAGIFILRLAGVVETALALAV